MVICEINPLYNLRDIIEVYDHLVNSTYTVQETLHRLTFCSRSFSLSSIFLASAGSTLTSILCDSELPEDGAAGCSSDCPLFAGSVSFSSMFSVPDSSVFTLHKGNSCSVSWKCEGKPKLSIPALTGPPPGYIWITEPCPWKENTNAREGEAIIPGLKDRTCWSDI